MLTHGILERRWRYQRDAQLSDGNSVYHGLTVNVQKRFSHSFEMLPFTPWSHTDYDSTDAESPLEPQDKPVSLFERSIRTFRPEASLGDIAVGSVADGDKAGTVLGTLHRRGCTLSPTARFFGRLVTTIITGTDFDWTWSLERTTIRWPPGAREYGLPFIPRRSFVCSEELPTNGGQAFSVTGNHAAVRMGWQSGAQRVC